MWEDRQDGGKGGKRAKRGSKQKGKPEKPKKYNREPVDESDTDDQPDEAEGGSGSYSVNGGARPKYAPVKSADVQRLHSESDCTIQVLHPQQYSEPMWRVNAALENKFGTLVGANVYITPPSMLVVVVVIVLLVCSEHAAFASLLACLVGCLFVLLCRLARTRAAS